jgi:hypothetical protein
VLVAPTRFAALADGTITRDRVTHTWSTIGLYRATNGRIHECTLLPLDASAFDAAWS